MCDGVSTQEPQTTSHSLNPGEPNLPVTTDRVGMHGRPQGAPSQEGGSARPHHALCSIIASLAFSRHRGLQFLSTNSINTLFFGGVPFPPSEVIHPLSTHNRCPIEAIEEFPFSLGPLRGEGGSKSKPLSVHVFKFTEEKCQISLQNVLRPDLTPDCTVRRNRWEKKRRRFSTNSFLLWRGFSRNLSPCSHPQG